MLSGDRSTPRCTDIHCRAFSCGSLWRQLQGFQQRGFAQVPCSVSPPLCARSQRRLRALSQTCGVSAKKCCLHSTGLQAQRCLASSRSAATSVAEGLPIAEVLPQVLEELERSAALVLQAPPGAGKTTAIPPALLLHDPSWLQQGQRILVLEPRRVAATAAARRMALLLGESVGHRIGYRVRLDVCVSSNTRVEVVTTGILLRCIQQDPELHGVAGIIFDEFHERSTDSDLALALCLDAQHLGRPDLRLLVMSATLGGGLGERTSQLLGGPDGPPAPLLVSEGRSYPVATKYLGLPGMERDGLERAAAAAVQEALANEAGDVLVFLPGMAEIRNVQRKLEGMRLPADVVLLPMHGSLSPAEQDRAIKSDPEGRRRVVLSSPVAESSLTLEGVRVVVDSGFARMPRYDGQSGMDVLQLVRISKASAEQRQGRAGRLGPGVCYRLWTPHTQASLQDMAKPEISVVDLTGVALQLALWGCPGGEGLPWLDAPPRHTLQAAFALLRDLGAVTQSGQPTDHGRQIGALGVHPRLAHMMLRARQLGQAEVGGLLAAMLTERDLLPGRHVGADLQLRLDALLSGEVHQGAGHRVRASAQQLLRELKRSEAGELDCDSASETTAENDCLSNFEAGQGQEADVSDHLLGVLVAEAYPDRIAQRQDRGNRERSRYLLSSGRGARLPWAADPLGAADWLAVAQLSGGLTDRNQNIALAAPLTAAAIHEHLSHLVREEEVVFWAAGRQAVAGRRRQTLGELVLQEAPRDVDDAAALPALLQGLREMGLKALPWGKDLPLWQQRVVWLRQQSPDLGLPDLSEEALSGSLDAWLAPFLAGMRSKADLQKLDLPKILRSQLTWEQQQAVETQAPSHWTVPSGTRVRIDYTVDPPSLQVRLQELFGSTETPIIAGAAVALMVVLLSPNRRPVQTTQDLVTFWQTGYPQVKKELKGRYPKHYWPEDPLQAEPTDRTTKQMAAKKRR